MGRIISSWRDLKVKRILLTLKSKTYFTYISNVMLEHTDMQITESSSWRLASLQIAFCRNPVPSTSRSLDTVLETCKLQVWNSVSHTSAQGMHSSCNMSDRTLLHWKSIVWLGRASLQSAMCPDLKWVLLRGVGISKLFLGLLKHALRTRCGLCNGSWTPQVYWSALEEWEALRPQEECGACPFLLNFKQHFRECLGDRDI